ncbi:MAG: bi-domain-containing oxidoreductase [Bacteroidota bacterium]
MRQLVIRKGRVITEDIPAPMMGDKEVKIRVRYSCVSSGTENATVKSSGKPLLVRAKEKPEKVKKVLNQVLEDGIKETLSMVKNELNAGSPSGYSVSGEVIAIGSKVMNFSVGDLVAAAGSSANHAEIVSVPEMLVSKVDNESLLLESSSVALGAIAMHGIRRADLRIGEFCLVIGTGIIGLISIQILSKAGVRVFAVDVDQQKLELAKKFGAEQCLLANDQLETKARFWSNGYGVDTVLFTAATQSSDTLNQAFRCCRKKGKVVLVGVSGMQINRSDIYRDEIDFEISTSYGPGRYDSNYEENGQDYPIAYVRWTEGRNMAEYLRLIKNRTVDLSQLVTGVYPIDDAQKAYSRTPESLNLINIIEYTGRNDQSRASSSEPTKRIKNKVNVAIIGAGSFAKNMIAPNLRKLKAYYNLVVVCSRTGIKAKELATNFDVQRYSTDVDEVLENESIDLVIITTRHGSHGELVLKALKAGKHVFVEKPLATDIQEVRMIQELASGPASNRLLVVGFNRRFSKYIKEIKKAIDKRNSPLLVTYRMNAGFVPYDSWIHKDGGRIVGEACHIVDLMTYLTGSKINSVSVESINGNSASVNKSDNKSFTLKYEDGSIAVIHYFAIGSKALSKEYMEVHFDQQSIILDNYKTMTSYDSEVPPMTTRKSEKGHMELLEYVGKYLLGISDQLPIHLEDIFETSYATLSIANE